MKSSLYKEFATKDGNIITISKNSLIAPPSSTNDTGFINISYEIFDVINLNVIIKYDLESFRDWWHN